MRIGQGFLIRKQSILPPLFFKIMKEKINRYFEKQISLAERCAKESKGLTGAHWDGFMQAMIVAQREIKEMFDQEELKLQNTEFDYGHNISHDEL